MGLAAGPALATNGYFAHGYSAAQRAMGGAGTALPEDSLIITINPAGIAWTGDRLDFNLSVFSPTRGYDAGPVGGGAQNSILRIAEGVLTSKNEMYFIPGFAFTRKIDDQSSWGMAMYGNGGLNTEYHGNTAYFGEGFEVTPLISLATQCDGTFGGGQPVNGASDLGNFCGRGNPNAAVDLIQLFVVPSYAYKIGEKTSLGIGVILAGQRFRADGLGAFAQFSNAPTKVSDNGYELSFGYGARIGFMTAIIPGVGLGASYQTKVQMSKFDQYAGLFAEGGDFDVPSAWNVGLSFHINDDLRVVADYQRINFSEIRSVGNRFDTNDFVNNCARPRLLAGLGLGGSTDPSPSCLGSDSGPGFGWDDVSVIKMGVQYRFAAFKFRAGYSIGKQPLRESEVLFNILVPAVPKYHYTAGTSFQWSKSIGFDLSAMYVPSHKVRGKNPLSNTDANAVGLISGAPSNETAFGADPNDQDITLDMDQWEVTLGLNYRF